MFYTETRRGNALQHLNLIGLERVDRFVPNDTTSGFGDDDGV
jgi:hypothetical protein